MAVAPAPSAAAPAAAAAPRTPDTYVDPEIAMEMGRSLAPADPVAAAAAAATRQRVNPCGCIEVEAVGGAVSEVGKPIGRGLQPFQCYNVPTDVRARVQGAVKIDDLDKKTRDLIASAIKRGLQVEECPPEVIARWNEARQNPAERMSFFKEFVEDSSFGGIVVYERHARREEVFDETQYHRVNRVELGRLYQTDRFPHRTEWIDDVIKGARGVPLPHPDYPGSKEHELHRVLKSVVDGKRNSNFFEQGLGLDSAVAPQNAELAAAAAEQLQLEAQSSRGSMPQLRAGAGAPSPKRKAKAKAKAKPKPVLSDEQMAAAAALKLEEDRRKANRRQAEAHGRLLANLCLRLQRAAARLRTAPAGSRLTQAMVEDLEAEASNAREAEALRADCAARCVEPPDVGELKRSGEAAAKAAEARCKELGLQ